MFSEFAISTGMISCHAIRLAQQARMGQGEQFIPEQSAETRWRARSFAVLRMTEESDDAGIADEVKNLTPNPFP
jgi:hypothetical protein